jgi:Uma2 family endonuclease
MSQLAVQEVKQWSLREWLQLPEGPPFYELENGRLIEMPSPRREHQRVVAKLFNYLDEWCTVRELGTVVMEVDVALPTGRGYIPDIAFVRREREAELLAEDGKIHGAPDLVVEVLSEGSRSRDLFRKFEGYQEAGVRYYWIVDPEAWIIAEYELTEQGYVLRSVTEEGEVFRPSLFEGLEMDLKAIVTATPRP